MTAPRRHHAPARHAAARALTVFTVATLLVGCTQTVYVVRNDDGTFTEVDGPEEAYPFEDAGEDVVVVDDALEIIILPSHEYILIDETDDLVYVELDVAAQAAPLAERAPLNVALIVDRSGSMAGAKMEAAKAATLSLVDDLADGDRVSVISYASDVSVDVAPVRLDARSRAAIERIVVQMEAAGGTFLAGGLEVGAGEVLRDYVRDDLNRVILVSDGRPTVGPTDARTLEVHASRLYEEGVTITTMGVGYDYNEDLMAALAVAGGGNYYYVESPREMAGALDRELRSFGATVARDVELELRVPEGVRVREVFGYAHERRGDGVAVQMSAMSAGQRRRVLVALEVPEGRHAVPAAAARTIASGRVSYRSEREGARRTVAIPDVTVRYTRDRREVARSFNAPVVEKLERVRNAQLRDSVMARLDDGDAPAAQALVQRRLEEARRVQRVMPGSATLGGEVRELERLEETVARPPAPASDGYRHLRKTEKARAMDAYMH